MTQFPLWMGPALEATVTVFDSATNQLVGIRLDAQLLPCKLGADPLEGRIEELEFRGNGEFLVTWYPFETYHDYWGIYAYDPPDSELVMVIEGGNYIPETTDLRGTVEVLEDGSIRLEGIYFGAPPNDEAAETVCGAVVR